MAKRGELKPMDAWEQDIRKNAVTYSVVMFQPGVSTRVYQTFDNLEMAKKYGEVVLSEPNRIRAAMIYAINEGGHHALVGTINKHDMKYKEVEPKTW
jgi:hypothetical protein